MSQTCNTHKTYQPYPLVQKGIFVTEIYQNGKLAAKSLHGCLEGMTDIYEWPCNLTKWHLYDVTDIRSLSKYLREITSKQTDLMMARLYDEKRRRRLYLR
jgi:hypothetical protein